MAKLLTKKYLRKKRKTDATGKYYGRFIYTETLSTEEFVNHIVSHGSPFDRATITGVLAATCDCLVELTLDSKRVRLGDLGTFYMSAETEGTESSEDFTADNVKKVHLRFWPNQKRSYALDSVSNRKIASFTDLERLMAENSATGNPDSTGNDSGSSDNGSDPSNPGGGPIEI